MGSVAAGGTLGNLIPPSVMFIVYGAAVGESIGKLFLGGLATGVLEAIMFIIAVIILKMLRPGISPPREKMRPAAMFSAFLKIWPVAVLIFLVLGTIYVGVATPTEAAAFGATGALLICAYYHKLTWGVLKESLMRGVSSTAFILLILVTCKILGDGLSLLRVPAAISSWILTFNVPALGIYVLVILLYLVLGCFMDTIAMVLLTLPVVYPIMMSYGFDSVWFGVVVIILGEFGLITPPVGMNLFVIQGVTRRPLGEIIRGVVPFMPVTIILLVLMYFFPKIALWLPDLLFKQF